jgi:hypothetical protein
MLLTFLRAYGRNIAKCSALYCEEGEAALNDKLIIKVVKYKYDQLLAISLPSAIMNSR